jgi:peptide/nickel transport system ATP-binding protein
MSDAGSNAILELDNVTTEFHLRTGVLRAVDNVSFSLNRGEVMALVGESGCGKSITVKTIMRLIRKPGVSRGRIMFRGENSGSSDLHPSDIHPVDLLSLNEKGTEIRRIRGKHINMVFQEPMNAFSPVHTIANQMIEALMLHTDMNKEEARAECIRLLGIVGIPEPEKRIDSYSFQLSGGMRQRALIAMAISCNPQLLIADEPTTALDVSVQAQILKLLKDLQKRYGMSIIFITHDLAVVAQMVDRVCVMYLGQIVEEAPVREIFARPLHPYTRALMNSILDPSDKRRAGNPINTIKGLVPEPINLPEECHFRERCTETDNNCNNCPPELIDVGNGHKVRCHKYAGGKA